MTSFFPAPCLMGETDGSYSMFKATTGLVGEVNKRWPNRDHTSDGWIGDASHAARPSDHNPDWGASGKYEGIVRAVDIDSNGAPGVTTDVVKAVLNACIGDPRVYYVIWNRKIYSRTYGWVARAYTGSNPHDHHVHVSLRSFSGEFNTETWFAPAPVKVIPRPVSLKKVREQFLAAANGKRTSVLNDVARIQRVLKNREKADITVDGLAGKRTLDAWARYERKVGKAHSKGRGIIPDKKSLAEFSKGRFRVIE